MASTIKIVAPDIINVDSVEQPVFLNTVSFVLQGGNPQAQWEVRLLGNGSTPQVDGKTQGLLRGTVEELNGFFQGNHVSLKVTSDSYNFLIEVFAVDAKGTTASKASTNSLIKINISGTSSLTTTEMVAIVGSIGGFLAIVAVLLYLRNRSRKSDELAEDLRQNGLHGYT